MQTSKATNGTSSSAGFFQQLSFFVEKHKAASALSDTDLEKYLDKNFKQKTFEGERFINIDTLPESVRQFIELQNRIAGRNAGRSGRNSFFSEELDASLGPETFLQRLKREKRERLFRWMIEQMSIYTMQLSIFFC